MPTRVQALLVVRPGVRAPAAAHLRHTLAALRAQTRPVDALTIVICGTDEELLAIASESGAENIVSASRNTGFAQATTLAEPHLDCDAVWLLGQDTAPEPEALAQLAASLEVAPSVAYAAPKLVRWNESDAIVSLGQSLTRFGRSVELADGELDQGQHDTREDVLGADIRGLLVRAAAWKKLDGIDKALTGADEGLDLGVRARLAGDRIALAPFAIIAVAGDGAAGLPEPTTRRRIRHRAFASRAAALHRRLVYAAPLAVVFQWLAILPLALGRTLLHLLAKRPIMIVPELRAAFVEMFRWQAVASARRRIRLTRSTPPVEWSLLAPLRVSAGDLRRRLEADPDAVDDSVPRNELGFFTGGGAWVVLAALAVSVAAFTSLLAWPVLGGGALAPLRSTVTQLWTDALFGQRQIGLDLSGPADPFSAVIALIGSFSPLDPSRVLVVLWVLALPLAVLGGWFAASRVTDRPYLRIVGALAWGLAPTFLTALVDGRPAAVLTHLMLPWFAATVVVAHRSWAAAGAASLLAAGLAATAPSLVPALFVLWLLAIVLVLIRKRGRGFAQILWLVVPAAALFAPLAWRQFWTGDLWGLLADPGVVWAGPQVAADPAGRMLLALGFPTTDPARWAEFLGEAAWWAPLLTLPVIALAVFAPLTPRWFVGGVTLVVAVLGTATAFAAVGVSVTADGAEVVALWPGNGLSFAWLGLVGGAVLTLDTAFARRVALARPVLASVALIALAVLAFPSLTAQTRGVSGVTNGPISTLPAYVAAEGIGNPRLGTIVLTPQADGAVATRVVWGGSETLGGQTTLSTTAVTATPGDRTTASLAADLVTSSSTDVVSRLAARGVGFVLLAPGPAPESTPARSLLLTASSALDQREGLDAVGDTARGTLWRVVGSVTDRPAPSADVRAKASTIGAIQLAVIAAAILLALPTAASRRASRRKARIVGLTKGELE